MKKIKLGFLVSHRGTNMQAVIDACNQNLLNAIPAVVITNNPNCKALQRARTESIPYFIVDKSRYDNPDKAMVDILQSNGIELVILAGYMKKVGDKLINTYRNRIVNIHPSLLPRHGGQGMYGSKVHKAVLNCGDSNTGATVHLVEREYDKGPILAQQSVEVEPNDTPDSLAARVLAIEHSLLVETLRKLISRELQIG